MSRIIWSASVSMFLAFLFAPLPIEAEESEALQRRRVIFESLSQEMGQGAVELKELEIRAKIYEPQVIYILDRARIEVQLREDPLQLSPRIPQLIEEDVF